MEKKYVICPGIVMSQTDRQWHYISARTLMKLYNVDPRECWIDHGDKPYRYPVELKLLFPRYDGNYTLES